MSILFLDIETTGFPNQAGLPFGMNPPYEEIDKYESARIVQMSLMVCNENFEQIEFYDNIVNSEQKFSIPNSHFHGITNEISNTQGKPFTEIIKTIISPRIKQSTHVFAHNANFDLSVLKSELYRHNMHYTLEALNKKNIICTMKITKNIVNVRNNYGIKNPSLAELYQFATQKPIQNAHNSKYDVINLHEAIKSLIDKTQLKIDGFYPKPISPVNADEVKSEIVPVNADEVKSVIVSNVIQQNNSVDFSKLKVDELQKYCKENGIKGYSKMNKKTLLEIINAKKTETKTNISTTILKQDATAVAKKPVDDDSSGDYCECGRNNEDSSVGCSRWPSCINDKEW